MIGQRLKQSMVIFLEFFSAWLHGGGGVAIICLPDARYSEPDGPHSSTPSTNCRFHAIQYDGFIAWLAWFHAQQFSGTNQLDVSNGDAYVAAGPTGAIQVQNGQTSNVRTDHRFFLHHESLQCSKHCLTDSILSTLNFIGSTSPQNVVFDGSTSSSNVAVFMVNGSIFSSSGPVRQFQFVLPPFPNPQIIINVTGTNITGDDHVQFLSGYYVRTRPWAPPPSLPRP